ncbi:MAG: hypothetical protein HYS12_23380 [Planctomycetes bacterium]|nr:hypothetical protein [Planctomycetota bacterium]
MRRDTFLAAVVLISVAAVRAQDAFPITINEPGKGDLRLCDVSQNTLSSTKIVRLAGGQSLHEKAASNAQHNVYRETILDRQPGQQRPTRLRRQYEKAAVWTEGKQTVLPYQGKTVLIESRQGVYVFSIEGGKALADEADRLLDREFNREDALDLQRLILPGRAVRLDQAWTIDMTPIARAWERNTMMRIDAAKSTGTGRLTKVYQKDGHRFGMMAIRLEMPIAALGADKPIRTDAGSRVRMDVVLNCCIDGTSSTGTLRASFWVDGTAEVPTGDGQRARLTFTTRGSLQKLHTDLPRR